MMTCTQCGAELRDGIRFCTECGAPATQAAPPPEMPVQSVQPELSAQSVQQPITAEPAQQQPAYTSPAQPIQQPRAAEPPRRQAPPQQQPAYTPPPAYTAPPASDAPPAGSKYELISTGGLIGIMLLMAIPIIGQILMIVWACGGCRKLQKRNLARAALILAVIALILGLLVSFAVKKIIGIVEDEILAGTQTTQESSGLLGGLLGNDDKPAEETENSGLIGGLLGLLGGETATESTGNAELDELQEVLGQLEAITGESSGLDELIGEVGEINAEASAKGTGWPSELPDFPSGTKQEVETYRTEFVGTTLEDTKAYIETLKSMGYEYQDFYDMGMSEADMMEYGGWWGTNGKWYLSISYSEGTTLIDHMTELPDLSSILGG